MKRKKEEDEAEIDVDQDFLNKVLDRLYDFGDRTKNKSSKKRQKKNNTRRSPDDEDVEDEDNLKTRESLKNIQTDLRHMTDRSQDSRVSAISSADGRSETLESRKSNVEVVTFQDPLKKNKLKKTEEPKTSTPEVKKKKQKTNEDPEISIEQARLDVHRFGIAGFQKQEQRVFEQDRAIMLGARPPKKEFVNYKVYQQMIKERKMKEKDETKQDPLKKKKVGGKPRSTKRKPSSSGAEPSGQVGQFKDGMLLLSTKDIQKLKGKVKK